MAARDGVAKLLVGAVVIEAGSVLLLERTAHEEFAGLVELPSGHVESGETLMEALQRELAEETGLSIHSVVRYIGSFDYTTSPGRRSRQFNFIVRTRGGPVRVSPDEHTAYFWLTPLSAAYAAANISRETRTIIEASVADG